jgi:hypothetical protein
MKKYDLHVHTDESCCSRASPEEIVDMAVNIGLDGLVITDHNKVSGVSRVIEKAGDDLTVVPGVEFATNEGDIIGVGVGSNTAKRNPIKVLDHIHSNGGKSVLAHPCDDLRNRFEVETLNRILPKVDAVETINSRCLLNRFNDRASDIVDNSVATTGGSDAHFTFELGRAYTLVPEDTSLLEAIEERKTVPHGSGRYMSGHIATKSNDLVEYFTANI